ncbi:MAG: response regulator [Flavobacteriaceae bacterium]
MKRPIAIVEDDRDLREALCLMIQYTEHYQVIAAFQNAEEAIEGIPSLTIDAVLMDINLPGESGIECVRKLKWQHPQLLFYDVYIV